MNRMGNRSRAELRGVHPDLIVVTTTAMLWSDQDFTVFDGIRTEDEQRHNVRRGVSWTMESKHLPQPDGLGHAVDLVPLINGKARWDSMTAFKELGHRMREAAEHHGVSIIWGAHKEHGGDWERINDAAHFELG